MVMLSIDISFRAGAAAESCGDGRCFLVEKNDNPHMDESLDF
jgi:hypothetical protein